MGVATANSILVVSFAREQLEVLVGDAREAALRAGFVRFRPVLMTALAMIIGMVPMALGMGEGGEQNAPLGRAVIGGLLVATVATLLFVPAFFSLCMDGWSGGASAPSPAGPTPSLTNSISIRSSDYEQCIATAIRTQATRDTTTGPPPGNPAISGRRASVVAGDRGHCAWWGWPCTAS